MIRRELKRVLKTGDLQSPEDVLGMWMWRLSLGWQRRAEASLRPLGLTHLQYVVLALSAWLSASRQDVSQRDLVNACGVQEAQISAMVKALRKKGLVTQTQGSTDTRSRTILITAEGLTLLRKADPLVASLQKELWPRQADADALLENIKRTLARWQKLEP